MLHVVITDTSLKQAVPGGAQSFLVGLCRGLVAAGWRVTVITNPGSNGASARSLEAAGVTVVENVWRPWELPEGRADRLAGWIARERADVHVISVSSDAGWLALPLLPRHIGTVSVAHNDVETFYAPLRHYAAFVDCAVGVSLETRRRIVEECGLPAIRSAHIPYGVLAIERAAAETRASSRPPNGKLRIGYVGRLEEEQKRIFDLVPILTWLRGRGVEFELEVVGDGSCRQALRARLETSDLATNVRFWGWLSAEQVRNRLAEIDVFVLPSAYEGMPVALIEAMANAVAPIATRVASGSSELIQDGRNGYLVPIGDTAAFGERLGQLAKNPQLLRSMRFAAWETGSAYSLRRMCDRYREAFEAMIEGNVTRAPKPDGPFPTMPSCQSRYPTWLRSARARLVWHLRRAFLRTAA